MKKISFCSILLLFSIQGFANITCNEQYGGGYNCYNFETGQSQTININSYPDNDIQPVPMPDLSSLPDPTAMMSMDTSQVNEMFNPEPLSSMHIQPSSANIALQQAYQTQMQINAQAAQAQANLARQEQIIAEQRQRSLKMAIQAQRQANIEAQARQQSAQQQPFQSSSQNTNDSQPSNVSNHTHNSDTKNYIIGILIFIIAIMSGIFWQKNRQN